MSVVSQKFVYPVRKPRHSCLSADRYGGDDMDKISAPYRKGGVKAPTLSNGVYLKCHSCACLPVGREAGIQGFL